jgi:hypothetical protein
MAKIIKLKQSDIVKIVENVIKDKSDEVEIQKEQDSTPSEQKRMFTLAKDEDGNYYVLDNANTDNPEIVASSKDI